MSFVFQYIFILQYFPLLFRYIRYIHGLFLLLLSMQQISAQIPQLSVILTLVLQMQNEHIFLSQ